MEGITGCLYGHFPALIPEFFSPREHRCPTSGYFAIYSAVDTFPFPMNFNTHNTSYYYFLGRAAKSIALHFPTTGYYSSYYLSGCRSLRLLWGETKNVGRRQR